MRSDLYVVKKGDTLWDLAGKFLGNHFEWPRLWIYNNRPLCILQTGSGIENPDLIYIGQRLLIPTTLTYFSGPYIADNSNRQPAKPLKEQLSEILVPFSIKYKLEDLKGIEVDYPHFSASIKLQGNLIITLSDQTPLGYVTNKGSEAVLARKAKGVLGQLTSEHKVVLEGQKITYSNLMIAKSNASNSPSMAIGTAVSSDKGAAL